MSEAETLIATEGGLGHLVLNRPRVLNALSPAQLSGLGRLLLEWRDDPRVGAIIVEGAGDKAFCAGGDIRAVWDHRLRGEDVANRAIFRDEYRLDRLIHHYPKPYVSLLDGIVMGGGAGISINGSWRVATERTVFAMPEAAIGFFPDVGATHFLSRCPGRMGLYLGLTGARLGPADCLWTGVATHYVPSDGRAGLKRDLAKAAASAEPKAAVEETLARHHRDPGASRLAGVGEAVERVFGRPGLAEVLAALAAEPGLASVGTASPTSLAVTFAQLTTGRDLTFDEAIRREFRMACRFLAGHDFYEGIRALVVDKDRVPRWSPATVADLRPGEVDKMFAPLLDEEDLEFFPD